MKRNQNEKKDNMIRTRYRINFESTKQQGEAKSILFNKIVIWKSFGQRRRQRERELKFMALAAAEREIQL